MKLLRYAAIFLFSFSFSNGYAATTVTDPCENLPGNWKGLVKVPDCTMDVYGTFERNKKKVRFEVHGRNPQGPCSPFDAVWEGTCKKAFISLVDNQIQGSICGTHVSLYDLAGSTMEISKVN